jgi:hypothetical protein
MNLRDAIEKVAQILDEERVKPTTRYAGVPGASVQEALLVGPALVERGVMHPRTVQEGPEKFQFSSTNFDLLSALLDQVSDQDKPLVLDSTRSRISQTWSFSHKPGPVLGMGTWDRCTSELPLIVEFLARRGEKQPLIRAISEAAPSPGLTLLLMQLEEMIALNFTLFTEEEYSKIQVSISSINKNMAAFSARRRPSSTAESNTIYNVCREIPVLCKSVVEECRKAKYIYLKGSLLPGMNLEVNQDKVTVRTFLEKLGFTEPLIRSLDETEKSYRTAATPFELKSSMGHLRSFLEQLHLQACALAHRKLGGSLPEKWGEAIQYLRDRDVLTTKEQQFAANFYTLMSDTTVHPLVADREYARLMRNMSIEYGLLLLTKLDKLGLSAK